LGLLFLDFSTFLIDFTRCWTNLQNKEEFFALGTLKLLKSLQFDPRFIPLGPDGGDRLAGGEVVHDHANMLGGSLITITCNRLVEVDRLVRTPVSGGGGTAATRPREARRR
jgi:hypothetical protein